MPVAFHEGCLNRPFHLGPHELALICKSIQITDWPARDQQSTCTDTLLHWTAKAGPCARCKRQRTGLTHRAVVG
eukprot:3000974-Rhodomonas_salina.2